MLERRSTLWVILLLGLLSLGAPLRAKPSWKVYAYIQNGHTLAYLNGLPFNNITHLMDAFALPNATPGSLNMTNASGANLITAAHGHSTRAILSLGGAFPAANTTNFANNTSTLANRNAFVAAITNTVATYGYDGVDIDWEFPTAGEKTQFMAFMQQLYTAIKAMPNAYDGLPRDLTFFISAGGQICGVDWTTIGNYCDAGIMSGYDYYVDNYNGPLSDPGVTYGDCAGKTATADIQGTFAKLTTAGMTAGKLALGCPLYGTPGVMDINTMMVSGTGYAYHTPQQEFSANVFGTNYWADDATSYCAKINWMNARGMQGIGLWEVGYAWPAANASVTAIWDTIGGIAACVSTGSPTSTATPTRTRTVTPTYTGTSTRTVTPLSTSTATATRTVTATSTSSVTPLSSATSTVTPSATPSVTRTVSATATSSVTPLSSATSTVTPSVTPSRTATQTVTPTFTRTSSATPSGTPTATQSHTASPIASATDTSTVTATPSISPTFSGTTSPSITPTPTLSFTTSPLASDTSTVTPSTTPSITVTGSSTVTLTLTPTATLSHTASPLASDTVSPTLTSTATASPMPTGTSTSTRTPTPSSTSTDVSTATYTSTSTETPVIVASATATPAAATPAPNTEPPKPVDTCALPNPQWDPERLTLNFLLKGDADSIRVDVYTKAMTKIIQTEVAGPFAAGRHTVTVALPKVPNGLYYAVVLGKSGSAAPLRGPIAKVLYVY